MFFFFHTASWKSYQRCDVSVEELIKFWNSSVTGTAYWNFLRVFRHCKKDFSILQLAFSTIRLTSSEKPIWFSWKFYHVSPDKEVPLNFVNRWDPESRFGLWIHIPDPDNIHLFGSPCSPVLLFLSKLMQIISINWRLNLTAVSVIMLSDSVRRSFHFTIQRLLHVTSHSRTWHLWPGFCYYWQY